MTPPILPEREAGESQAGEPLQLELQVNNYI